MKISLKEAVELLESADVVRIVVDGYIEPSLEFSPLTGDEDNQFLYVTWEEDNLEFSVKFVEGNNASVVRNGNALRLIDNEGQDLEFQLFSLTPMTN